MSLTEPPAGALDHVDRPPSLRFKVVFGAVILLIAVGYAWVWQVKTERVVPEPPPVLGFIGATSDDPVDPDANVERDANVDPDADVDPDANVERVRAGRAHFEAVVADALRSVPGLIVVTGEEDHDTQGIDQLVFAELATTEGGHRIVLRRTSIHRDTVFHVYRVQGSTLRDAAHRLAVQVAMSFGLARPAAPDSIR